MSQKNEKILLQLRDNKPNITYPNYWSLIGGHVEKNEDLDQAISREIKEEINCIIKGIKYIGEIVQKSNPYHKNGLTLYIFKGKIDKEIEEIDLMEGQKISYFTFEEILNLRVPPFLREFIINNKKQIFI